MAEYNIRQERSNAGVSALTHGILTNVLGLTADLASRVLDTIETSGELPALRQSIKLLPLSHHSQLNAMIDSGEVNGVEDTPFNDDDLDDNSDADTIEPDEVLDDLGVDKSELRNNADADEYDTTSRNDEYRENVSSFKSFRENANMNAKLDAEISSDMDNDIDERTLKKIKNLEAKGQKQSADHLRKQALRRNSTQHGNSRPSPTERTVLAKKKDLARAIQADKQAKAKELGA